MLSTEELDKLSEHIENLSCTDPKAGDGLFTFVMLGEVGDQKPHYERHLAECEYCRTALQIYRHKRDAARVLNKWHTAKEITSQASTDPRILRRDLGNGSTAYFRPRENSAGGTTVVVDSGGDCQSVEEQSLAEFQRLK